MGWRRTEITDTIIQQERGAEGKTEKANKEAEAVGVDGLNK